MGEVTLDFGGLVDGDDDEEKPERKEKRDRTPRKPSIDMDAVVKLVHDEIAKAKADLRSGLQANAGELWGEIYPTLAKLFRSGKFRAKIERLGSLLSKT